MSNIIPPLLSDSPPPMVTALDVEEDEFGDFTSAGDASYNYDNYSLPSSPRHTTNTSKSIDINSNTSKLEVHSSSPNIPELFKTPTDKDFQDKRKNCDLESISATEVNLIQHQPSVYSVHNDNDIYCCNQNIITDQQLPTESVPINEILMEDSLGHVTAKANEDESSEEINENIVICNNKEKVAEVIHNIDINVPSTMDTTPSLNDVSAERCTSHDVSGKSFNEVPFESSKGTNDIREDFQMETVVTKDTHIDGNEINIRINGNIDNFFYGEEPPDLNVIDDKTIEIDDFTYYNSYESDLEIETVYSKVENQRDVNENTVNSKRDDNKPAIDSLKSVDNVVRTENVLSANELYDDKLVMDFGKSSHLNAQLMEKNEQSNLSCFNNTQHESENVDTCEHTTKPVELEVIHKDAQKLDELTNIANSGKEELEVPRGDESTDKTFDLDNVDTSAVSSERTADTSEEFGDFANPLPEICATCNKITEDNSAIAHQEDTSDFGDFANPLPENSATCNEIIDDNLATAKQREISDFGDFADFSQSFPEASSNLPELQVSTSHKISSLSEQLKESQLEDFEENELYNFGEFAQAAATSGSSNSTSTNICAISGDNILEHVEKLLLQVFPLCITECDNYVSVEYLSGDRLFSQMKDITETHALSYQWAKSTSQEKLLNALNIDTRNILYGPGWNPLMPKFAANLRTTPLEPVKSEILTPTPACPSNLNPSFIPSGLTAAEVPSAQFDWKGAGLVNPLDSLPPNPKEKTYDLDIKTENIEKPLDFLSHRRSHSDNESVKSLQLTTDTDRSDVNSVNPVDEFDDFTGYQPSSITWQKNVPLKETYISSELLENTKSDPFNLITPGILTSEVTKHSEEDDEFTDFQMSLPLRTSDEFAGKAESKMPVSEILQPVPAFEPLKPCLIPKTLSAQPEILWPDPGITSDELLNIELSYSRKTSCDDLENVVNSEGAQLENKTNNMDITSKKYNIINSPSLENRLDPKVVNGNLEHTRKENVPKSQKLTNVSKYANSIINEDKVKINKVENKHQINKVSTNILQPGLLDKENIFADYRCKTEKSSNLDIDDEWSDFVCNPEPLKYCPKPAPTFSLPERTNTPELQLSIPHLSQLQPPKQPIPVITPHGLLQTKIPSNTSNLNVYHSPHSSTLRNVYQPSIISQQYQNHLNGPVFPKLPQNGVKVQENLQPKLNLQPYESFGKTNTNDDDDWTEFVSSAPMQQPKTQQHKIQKQNCNNWSGSVVPNIITNPAHFDLRNYVSQKPQNSGTILSFTKSMVPSISALPELDFAAPKSKSFKKK